MELARRPAWAMRVMLGAMRAEGWSFERAWSNAIQRIRESPSMSEAERSELAEWRVALEWSKPIYRACYEGGPVVAVGLPQLAAALTDADFAAILGADRSHGSSQSGSESVSELCESGRTTHKRTGDAASEAAPPALSI